MFLWLICEIWENPWVLWLTMGSWAYMFYIGHKCLINIYINLTSTSNFYHFQLIVLAAKWDKNEWFYRLLTQTSWVHQYIVVCGRFGTNFIMFTLANIPHFLLHLMHYKSSKCTKYASLINWLISTMLH